MIGRTEFRAERAGAIGRSRDHTRSGVPSAYDERGDIFRIPDRIGRNFLD